VAVITTLNHNPGDDYIRYGMYHLMSNIFAGAEIRELHKHDALIHRPQFHETIDWADAVIQAGTPCYWCQPHHHSGMSEWADTIWNERLFQDQKKLVLNLGAGSYFGYYSDASHALQREPFVRYINQMTKRSDLTTVRDSLAQSLLSRMGFDVPLLSCPAAWGQDYVGNTKTMEKDRSLIVGSYQKMAGHYNFNKVGLNIEGFGRFYRTLMTSLSSHYRVVIVSHSPKDYQQARECIPELEHFLIPENDSKSGLDIYARASIYIGTRIHGAYSVISSGSPAILFSSDSRSRMLDIYGMPRFFINELVNPDSMRELAIDMMKNTTSESLENIKQYHYAKYQKLLSQCLDTYSQQV